MQEYPNSNLKSLGCNFDPRLFCTLLSLSSKLISWSLLMRSMFGQSMCFPHSRCLSNNIYPSNLSGSLCLANKSEQLWQRSVQPMWLADWCTLSHPTCILTTEASLSDNLTANKHTLWQTHYLTKLANTDRHIPCPFLFWLIQMKFTMYAEK